MSTPSQIPSQLTLKSARTEELDLTTWDPVWKTPNLSFNPFSEDLSHKKSASLATARGLGRGVAEHAHPKVGGSWGVDVILPCLWRPWPLQATFTTKFSRVQAWPSVSSNTA